MSEISDSRLSLTTEETEKRIFSFSKEKKSLCLRFSVVSPSPPT
jgi:hypothetical protein